MRASRLKIANILGIQELNIELGQITEIEGKNGAGKTSVIEAVKALVQGGSDATLLRKGTQKGEAVLIIEDGEMGQVEIKRTYEKGERPKLSVNSSIFGEVKEKPQAFVARLLDSLSVNPVEFLLAPPKDRTRYLLEALPLKVTPEQLTAVGVDSKSPNFGLDLCERHALEVLDIVHKVVYDQRTGVNRAAKEKQATVQELGRGLLPEPVDPAAIAQRLKKLEAEGKRADASAAKQELDFTASAGTDIERFRQAAQEQIEHIRAKLEAEIELVHAEHRKAFALIEERDKPAREEHTAAYATLIEQGKQAERDTYNRQVVGKLRAEAEELEKQSLGLCDKLDAVETLRGKLLADLPIRGLEIIDGLLYRDGIPFDRLNATQRVQIGVKVAKLHKGSVGLICIDGIEMLDSEMREAFLRAAEQDQDTQFIVTRVSDTALQVHPPRRENFEEKLEGAMQKEVPHRRSAEQITRKGGATRSARATA